MSSGMSMMYGGGGKGSGDDEDEKAERNRRAAAMLKRTKCESNKQVLFPDTSDEDDDEVKLEDNKVKKRGLGSLVSDLEATLPMKRGLSSAYDGKSKSFTDLIALEKQGVDIQELKKKEHPKNKKRRMRSSHDIMYPSFKNFYRTVTTSNLGRRNDNALEINRDRDDDQDVDEDDNNLLYDAEDENEEAAAADKGDGKEAAPGDKGNGK